MFLNFHGLILPESQSDIVGVVWVSMAIIGAGCASPLVDRTHAYKTFMVVTMVIAFATMLAFTMVLYVDPTNFILIILSGGAMGLGASGIPAIIEAAIESTYPNGVCHTLALS
jgi:hypothetical protein